MSDGSSAEWTLDYILEKYPEEGHQFEVAVANLYESMGFITRVTQKSNDDGIDVIVCPATAESELMKRAVQVKRYADTSVQKCEVGYLVGASIAEGVPAADLVTTSQFTKGAWDLARRVNATGAFQLTLVNGHDLVNQLNEYRVGLD